MKKARFKKERQLPIWLKRLGRVKQDLKAIHWPKGEEGFQQALALMALGLESLENASRGQSADCLIEFSKRDSRWIKRWRQERGKVFPASD